MPSGILAEVSPGYRASALAALVPVIAAADAERADARQRAGTPEARATLRLAEHRLALLRQSRTWLMAAARERDADRPSGRLNGAVRRPADIPRPAGGRRRPMA